MEVLSMVRLSSSPLPLLLLSAAALTLASCGGSGGASGPGIPRVSSGADAVSLLPALSRQRDTDTSRDTDADDGVAVLRQLDDIITIGSTVDPQNGDQNPYGLDVARVDADQIETGDLVVCNFNNAANVQGTGTTIVALHPRPGSTPLRIAAREELLGCDALALAPNDNIWAAAFADNDNPIVSPSRGLLTSLDQGPWHGPFGQTFAAHPGPFGIAAFYESNAGNGSIVRIDILSGGGFRFDVIATGFAVNHGAPGSILGPSGLQYDAKHDRLYIVDGADNTLVAFRHVSTIPAGGIVVNGGTFSGPFAHRARLVFSGAPLNGPISSALLPNGHLVLGNTLDPNGQNLMVEITANGRVLAIKNVDTGLGAALFGMVAAGRSLGDLKLYFNDDNDNTVKALTH
ncbi:MAG: hypothetical protein ABI182_00885 [Candidatus Baltobacteraceae bacterium]